MQSQLVSHLFARALHDHDDRIHAAIGLNVLVGVDNFVRPGLKSIDTTDRDVLLQRREHRVDVLFEVGDGLVAVSHHGGGDLVGQGHKLLGLGDEVGLAAQLHDGGDVAVTHDGDCAFARFAARRASRPTRGPGCAAADGRFHVAVCVFERPLCVHHADARRLAQVLYVFGGDRHLEISSSKWLGLTR